MVKCSEMLWYSDGLSNKLSNIIRRHIDIQTYRQYEALAVCIVLLSHFFHIFRFYFLSMHIWLYSCLIL